MFIRIAIVSVKCTLLSYTTDVSENLFRSHISEKSEVKCVCTEPWSIAQTSAKNLSIYLNNLLYKKKREGEKKWEKGVIVLII